MIREPAVAGMFYPASQAKLEKEIQHMLAETQSSEQFENIYGIVVPHAGYMYSGKTAAYAYNAISNKNIKTAVIISPSHREYFPGISIYSGGGYKTPLGVVSVNKEMVAKLTSEKSYIFEGLNGHRAEHALEVQIPFLQSIYPEIEIVPIVMGDQRKSLVDFLAEKLADVINDENVIVASSDLSHFHSKNNAYALDSIVAQRITEFDYNGLQSDLDAKKCEACGGGPIISLMKAAALRNKKKSKVLARTDSGDVTGDPTGVVGYLSAIIFG